MSLRGDILTAGALTTYSSAYVLAAGTIVDPRAVTAQAIGLGSAIGQRRFGARMAFSSTQSDGGQVNYRVYAGLATRTNTADTDQVFLQLLGSGVITGGNVLANQSYATELEGWVDAVTFVPTTWYTAQLDALGAGTPYSVTAPGDGTPAWLTIGDAINARALLLEFQATLAPSVRVIHETIG